MSNLDNRIANADQLLTQVHWFKCTSILFYLFLSLSSPSKDVEKFCATVTELYSNISKPILDICLYFYQLSSSIGAEGPLIMLLYLAFSGLFLTKYVFAVHALVVNVDSLWLTIEVRN